MRPKEKTRELIARAALRLFVEKGIDGTTIRDIADAAGIAEGTLYRHYSGKDALAWDLFSQNYTAFALELTASRPVRRLCGPNWPWWQFCTFLTTTPSVQLPPSGAARALQKVTPRCPTRWRWWESWPDGRGEIPAGDPNVAAAMVLGIVLQVAVFKITSASQSLTTWRSLLEPAGGWAG
jgi:AcrR family transcriptional regulator